MGSKAEGMSASEGCSQPTYVAAGIKRAEEQAVHFFPVSCHGSSRFCVGDRLCCVRAFSSTYPSWAYFICFTVLYKMFQAMPAPRSDFPMFPSNCFEHSGLILRSLRHFELIYMQCKVREMKLLFVFYFIYLIYSSIMSYTYTMKFDHIHRPFSFSNSSQIPTHTSPHVTFSLYSFNNPLSLVGPNSEGDLSFIMRL